MVTLDQELLAEILDLGEIGLVLLDERREIRLWNDWMRTASGSAAAAAIGRDLKQVFVGQISPRLLKSIDAALDHGLAALLSHSLNPLPMPLYRTGRGDDGRQPIAQNIYVKPIRAAGGQRYCLVQVVDVTRAASREAVLRQQARTMEALAENYRLSELHTRAILDNTADAIITFDEQGYIGMFNPAAESIFGYAPRDIVSKPVTTLFPALSAASLPAEEGDAANRQRREIKARRSNGVVLDIELSVSEMQLGGQRLFIGIAHDITERKRAEEDRRNQQEWLSTLINSLPDIVCFKDRDSRWLVANHCYLELFGLQGHDFIGRTAAQLSAAANRNGDLLKLCDDSDGDVWGTGRPVSSEQVVPTETGDRVFHLTKLPLYNPDGSRKGLVVVGRDMTESQRAAAQIKYLAHHDSLTDLPNRVLFQERLRAAMAHARRTSTVLGLMFLDLDKFKDVNDTLGHHAGDLLLQEIADRLVRCVRETDTVARLGGDEFAILLTNLTDSEGATRVAETIIKEVAKPFQADENEILTSTSIGITLHPQDSVDADQLLRNADLALYRSKAEGRNNFHFFTAEMNAEVQARKHIERELRHALGTDQLMLYYQPLVDLHTGQISGCEALIRWDHPESGWISPSLFIPIAERTDLILPLGRFVLERACRQIRDWQDRGLPAVRVALNLSPSQFRQQDLVVMIAEAIETAGINADLLQLEITEGIAMHDVEHTIGILRQLRALGVKISIDDFGTGYSSLNYLKRFPVDKLKIDRSFIIDVADHPDNAAIVRAIISLGHAIGTNVNVEGVETLEQLSFLCREGVDEIQGYYFSRPLTPEDFTDLLGRPVPWTLPEAVG